ncbi:MFS transporter [Amycolatopsis endophytica]|uniref:MHS family proline/betaine transporter-like MFS transporter n=1 Tax=Amycolatopsis endophytica TaxID=860233 RepID=A0A853BCZ2_9PSEU|nr:MFS transporter [Amycolatopsis endophytica]NYI92286.1 MHS family proline/betaine transporter-like MFS transporter [Amycolatopsis endophytica]
MTTQSLPDRDRVARRAGIAAAVGTAIEYYDFAIYGYLATVLAPLFFPAKEGLVGLLGTLGVVAAGFLARPIGGLIFGRIGDRRGRKVVLMATVTCMGLATTLTGLLPTHGSIGVAAPMLLTVLRIVQGISAGGEIGGATSLSTESAPSRRRGLFGSATSIGISVGMALAAASVGTVSAFTTSEQMHSWGWRIPFLIAAPLLVVATLFRMRVEDSPLFLQMVRENEPIKAPVTQVFRTHKASVFRVVGLAYSTMTTGGIASVYILVHLSAVLKYSLTWSLWLVVLIVLLPLAVIPWTGSLSDRFGRRRMISISMVAFVVLAVPCFLLMQQGSLTLAIVAALILNIPFAMQQGVVYSMYSELFPTRIRYTGLSIGFNIGGVIGSGTVSMVATWLVSATGVTISPAFYVIFGAVVGLIVVATMRETSGEDLDRTARPVEVEVA